MTNWGRWGVLCGTGGFLASAAGCQDLTALETESVERKPSCSVDCGESAGNETSTDGDDR
ncbi:hypothetical protein [Natronorubrum tibetense]|uniref:hypothetical protein n=1 Tax=Natronorubrum tibetense TaxID=63128 RepID=UPI00036F1464|nr:hypothetical protein [Natronorubrum tibetense]